ncbi:MAG: hypothetical protein IAB88_02020 [Bacteroidetes bacterium]|uniref:Uncharacterized protein n=1 Tax=Candidatus Limisoma faecipullorum TaxID=2840854 RepID=A0A9D9INY9_9BACT|nr:hypothetical protein [Candidatus Limisoma faecipullorum]
MKRAILLAAAAVLALSGIYAKAPVVINNDDYIVCSQQKIKKLNRKICRKFRRTYWKEQISHDSIYIYHFFSIYRQFRQTGTFFNDWKLLPTDNFAIHRLYASYAYDRDLNIIGEYDFGDFYSFENIEKYWRIRIPNENSTIYYAASRARDLKIKYYFITKPVSLQIIGISEDGDVYVFWFDKETKKPSVTSIDNLPESEFNDGYYKDSGIRNSIKQFAKRILAKNNDNL